MRCGASCACIGRVALCAGMNVVDLPDVLFPEGQFLDMFDLESKLSGVLSDEQTNKQTFKVWQRVEVP